MRQSFFSPEVFVDLAQRQISLRRYTSAAYAASPALSAAFRLRSRNAATRQRPEQYVAVMTSARNSAPQRSQVAKCDPWILPSAANRLMLR